LSLDAEHGAVVDAVVRLAQRVGPAAQIVGGLDLEPPTDQPPRHVRGDAVDEVGAAPVEHVAVVGAVEAGRCRQLVADLGARIINEREQGRDVGELFHGTNTVSPGTSGRAGALPASTSRASTLKRTCAPSLPERITTTFRSLANSVGPPASASACTTVMR